MNTPPIKIPIPDWAFGTALEIAAARQYKFRNQFTTAKIRNAVADHPRLVEHVEGVIGYIGDICDCVWLGIDPKEMLRAMIVDTDLLQHRDEFDFVHKGWRVDVKTELYPSKLLEDVVARRLERTKRYGCRLINDNQFKENSGTIDIYLFATLDTEDDPREATYWCPVGWITKQRAKKVAPEATLWTPGGARLWVPAHCIPNDELENASDLLNVDPSPTATNCSNAIDRKRLSTLDGDRYISICEACGLK
jgi:hypothetical protein